mmetsp:Transcript_62178/g.136159  ORF Transcript_62178/g.136159 Transcript_62178/m.136159 type:complete len:302 (-) Transcript_62178:38-943(-)
MLNTPPDFKVAEVRNDCELESCSSCGYCEQYKQPELCDEKVDGQQAIVEVAKLAVEVKKLEATATVEVERLRQHGVTARVRISEENKTQRSACVAALVKRVVEEHHQTEREKIAATAETQQASIAAEVKKAELEAQRPKPVPEYFLLLLLYFQRHRRKMARVGVFLLLLKAFWTFSGSNSSISGRWSELWRGIIRLLQRRNLLGDGLFVGQQHRLPLAPLPPLQDSGETATASTGSDLGTLDKELEHQGLSEYNQVLRDTGYDDMGVLRELREEEEVEEMFRAIQCRPEHRDLFLRLLKRV